MVLASPTMEKDGERLTEGKMQNVNCKMKNEND